MSNEASPNLETPTWHAVDASHIANQLGVAPDRGLYADEVKRRRPKYGDNVIEKRIHRGPARILAAQFADFMIMVLIAAAVISGIVGEAMDALAILVIILLNAIIGFTQDYRAERALAALQQLAAPSARVRRDGHLITLPSSELIPGDIVLLEAGNLIPADLRLLEAAQLQVDEASLTGESVAINKMIDPLTAPDLGIGDRKNMAYKGTLVTKGRGIGIAVATGMSTQLGQIAALLQQDVDAKTPLQKRLVVFGRRLALAILVICAVILFVGLLRGEPLILMFLTAVSLAVAAIPEALPAVVTISLALGARKMASVNALIRRLPAVETLGSVTYICSDKTGTLTENQMRLEALHVDGEIHEKALPSEGELGQHLGMALALSNDVFVDEQGDPVGDPTEVALFEAAQRAGFSKTELENNAPRVAELTFDSDRKRMTTLHKTQEGVIAYTKGAPEEILSCCRDVVVDSGAAALDAEALQQQAEKLAGQGYRVLALALRHWPALPAELSPDQIETDLSFLGLAALIDPPRPEVADAVALCQTAGITPVMITGDHLATAQAIAERLGICQPNDGVISGKALARLSDQELAQRVGDIRVYARVSPAQKIRIVEALQQRGEFVAMTGDGVNDAPALKRADIGVAMGLIGTDVARESSQLVLLDDNFATIVTAVREGRRIFDNIRKFIKYTMTSNAGEIWTLFLAPFLGLPIPLLPIHILWINLVTDGLPGLALAVEPKEPGTMRRPPRPPNESIFAHGMWQHMIWVGLLIGGVSILAQGWAYRSGSAHWQTMVFTTLTFAQLAHVMAIRSERESTFKIGFLSNRLLLGAVSLTVLLQLATIYVPVLQPIFKTQPLELGELAICAALALIVFVAVEIEKGLVRRGVLYSQRG